jgi:hypothetical protein
MYCRTLFAVVPFIAIAFCGTANAQSAEELKPLTLSNLTVLAGPIVTQPSGRLSITEPNTRALFRVDRMTRATLDVPVRRMSAWSRTEGSGPAKRRLGLFVCYIDSCNSDRVALEFGDDLGTARLVYYKSTDFNFINDKTCKAVKFTTSQSEQFVLPDAFTLDFVAKGSTHIITARLRNIALSTLTVAANSYCEQFGLLSDNLSFEVKIATDGVLKPAVAPKH